MFISQNTKQFIDTYRKIDIDVCNIRGDNIKALNMPLACCHHLTLIYEIIHTYLYRTIIYIQY